MSISSRVVSVSLAAVGLVVTAYAWAMPSFSEQAPNSSIQLCVEQIAEQANYAGANRVRHNVDYKERRINGHKIYVETIVFAAENGEVMREYRTICSMSDASETLRIAVSPKRR